MLLTSKCSLIVDALPIFSFVIPYTRSGDTWLMWFFSWFSDRSPGIAPVRCQSSVYLILSFQTCTCRETEEVICYNELYCKKNSLKVAQHIAQCLNWTEDSSKYVHAMTLISWYTSHGSSPSQVSKSKEFLATARPAQSPRWLAQQPALSLLRHRTY